MKKNSLILGKAEFNEYGYFLLKVPPMPPDGEILVLHQNWKIPCRDLIEFFDLITDVFT